MVLTALIGYLTTSGAQLLQLNLAACHLVDDEVLLAIGRSCGLLTTLNLSNCQHVTAQGQTVAAVKHMLSHPQWLRLAAFASVDDVDLVVARAHLNRQRSCCLHCCIDVQRSLGSSKKQTKLQFSSLWYDTLLPAGSKPHGRHRPRLSRPCQGLPPTPSHQHAPLPHISSCTVPVARDSAPAPSARHPRHLFASTRCEHELDHRSIALSF